MKNLIKLFIFIFVFLYSLQIHAQDASIVLDSLINTQAKDFTVKTIKGKKYQLSELKNKVVVLNFWYMACAPCVKEMPALNKVIEKYAKQKDVIFLGISVTGVEEVVKIFVKRKQFAYQIVASDFTTAKKQGVQLYPTNIIIDKKGKITYATAGYNHNIVEILTQEIDKALK